MGRSVSEDLAGRLGLPPGEQAVAGEPGQEPEAAVWGASFSNQNSVVYMVIRAIPHMK